MSTETTDDKAADVTPCHFDGNGQLTACWALRSVTEPSARKGIVSWIFYDLKTMKRTRTLVGAKSGDHAKKGVVFNYCPFCGEPVHTEAEFLHRDGEPAKAEGRTP